MNNKKQVEYRKQQFKNLKFIYSPILLNWDQFNEAFKTELESDFRECDRLQQDSEENLKDVKCLN